MVQSKAKRKARTRRSYSEEFKQEAVQMLLDGHTAPSVAGLPLFRKEKDYEAFERIMVEAQARRPTRLLAWCVMRNHWHFVVWPRGEGEVTAHVRWLAHTHAMRWHVAHNTVGRGH